jgi:ketosteroid isomerase-like protein
LTVIGEQPKLSAASGGKLMIDRTTASLLCALAAGSLLAGCERHHRFAQAAEVVQAARTIVSDYNAGNAAAAAAQDAPDFVGIFHGTPNNVGPAADLAEMKAQMAVANLKWQIGEPRVTIAKAGDLALFEAPYTFTVTDAKGATTRESGNWIAIFKRQKDGTLKLWRSIGSDTLPVKPAGG